MIRVRVQRAGPPDNVRPNVIPPRLMRDDSEPMNRLGKPRLYCETMAVKRLRFRQPARPVMPEGNLKSPCNRHKCDGIALQPSNFRTTTVALCPPKPKLLLIAMRGFPSRAVCGT